MTASVEMVEHEWKELAYVKKKSLNIRSCAHRLSIFHCSNTWLLFGTWTYWVCPDKKFKGQKRNFPCKNENCGIRYHMLSFMAITTPYFMLLYIWPRTIIHRKNNSITRGRGQTRNRFRTLQTMKKRGK